MGLANGCRHIPSRVLHLASHRHRAQGGGATLPAYADGPSGQCGLLSSVEVKQAHGGKVDHDPCPFCIGQDKLQGQDGMGSLFWNPYVKVGVGFGDMLITQAKMTGDIQQGIAFAQGYYRRAPD